MVLNSRQTNAAPVANAVLAMTLYTMFVDTAAEVM